MGDYFNEQIVKRENSTAYTALVFCFYVVAGFLAFITFAFFAGLGIIATFALGFCIYFVYSRQNKEFEYVITNDTFDIDVIYNKSKRKNMFTANIKEITLMTYASNVTKKNEFDKAKKTLDFSSGKITTETIYFKINLNGVDTKVIIEPNEKILDGFKIYLNSRILILDK